MDKAHALPGRLWKEWSDHVLTVGPTWLWAALWITRLFGIRISEALALEGKNFNFRKKKVYLIAKKYGKEQMNDLLPPQLEWLKAIKRTNGKTVTRKRACGARGVQTYKDRWAWTLGPLFPALRKDCKGKTTNKDSVSKALSRARSTFTSSDLTKTEVKRVRSQTGRHRFINDCKASNMPDRAVMIYVRISDKGTYDGYGTPTPTQAGAILQASKRLRRTMSS